MEWHYVMLYYILHYIITSWFHNSIIKFYCYLLLLSFSVPGAAQPEAWGGAASASIREEISATPGNLGQEKARLGHNLDRMDKRVATQWRHWSGQRLWPTLTDNLILRIQWSDCGRRWRNKGYSVVTTQTTTKVGPRNFGTHEAVQAERSCSGCSGCSG